MRRPAPAEGKPAMPATATAPPSEPAPPTTTAAPPPTETPATPPVKEVEPPARPQEQASHSPIQARPADHGAPAKARPASEPSRISSALKVTGQLESDEDIQVDGHVEGDIRARKVTIGSIREARRAGIQPASKAAAARRMLTMA